MIKDVIKNKGVSKKVKKHVISEFFNAINQDIKLKEELNKRREKYRNFDLDKKESIEFLTKELIPLAREYGFNFDLQDYIKYFENWNRELSDEELDKVAGGINIRTLGLCAAFITTLGVGSQAAVPLVGSNKTSLCEAAYTKTKVRFVSRIPNVCDCLNAFNDNQTVLELRNNIAEELKKEPKEIKLVYDENELNDDQILGELTIKDQENYTCIEVYENASAAEKPIFPEDSVLKDLSEERIQNIKNNIANIALPSKEEADKEDSKSRGVYIYKNDNDFDVKVKNFDEKGNTKIVHPGESCNIHSIRRDLTYDLDKCNEEDFTKIVEWFFGKDFAENLFPELFKNLEVFENKTLTDPKFYGEELDPELRQQQFNKWITVASKLATEAIRIIDVNNSEELQKLGIFLGKLRATIQTNAEQSTNSQHFGEFDYLFRIEDPVLINTKEKRDLIKEITKRYTGLEEFKFDTRFGQNTYFGDFCRVFFEHSRGIQIELYKTEEGEEKLTFHRGSYNMYKDTKFIEALSNIKKFSPEKGEEYLKKEILKLIYHGSCSKTYCRGGAALVMCLARAAARLNGYELQLANDWKGNGFPYDVIAMLTEQEGTFIGKNLNNITITPNSQTAPETA